MQKIHCMLGKIPEKRKGLTSSAYDFGRSYEFVKIHLGKPSTRLGAQIWSSKIGCTAHAYPNIFHKLPGLQKKKKLCPQILN